MPNLNPAQKHKISQMLMTIFLVGVLFSIVALYLYYGMYLAKQTAVPAEVSTEEVLPQTELDERTQRLNVLNELSKESSSTASYEDRMKTLQKLEEESDPSVTTVEERLELLKNLESDTAADIVE
jgi:preprotein translocase subunit SecF